MPGSAPGRECSPVVELPAPPIRKRPRSPSLPTHHHTPNRGADSSSTFVPPAADPTDNHPHQSPKRPHVSSPPSSPHNDTSTLAPSDDGWTLQYRLVLDEVPSASRGTRTRKPPEKLEFAIDYAFTDLFKLRGQKYKRLPELVRLFYCNNVLALPMISPHMPLREGTHLSEKQVEQLRPVFDAAFVHAGLDAAISQLTDVLEVSSSKPNGALRAQVRLSVPGTLDVVRTLYPCCGQQLTNWLRDYRAGTFGTEMAMTPLWSMFVCGLYDSDHPSALEWDMNAVEKLSASGASRPDVKSRYNGIPVIQIESKGPARRDGDRNLDVRKLVEELGLPILKDVSENYTFPLDNRPPMIVLVYHFNNIIRSYVLVGTPSQHVLYTQYEIDLLRDSIATIVVKLRAIRDTAISIGRGYAAEQHKEEDFCLVANGFS